MTLIKTAVAGLILAFAMALPASANAAGETLEAGFSLTPQKGKLFKNGFKPADWNVENSVTATGPQILPSKVIELQFPANAMTFNPGNMAVCPDDQVGPPPTSLSFPVPTIVNRCPEAVLGNGTAKFVLAQNNLNPAAVLDGVMVVFNGGLRGGLPLIKVYAYSYDTTVAIYTESVLDKGNLKFNVPQLTADSSVSTLNLGIPSKNITLKNWGPGQETVLLPKGKKTNYVQAKCATGSWPWSAEFTHGTRDTNNDPTSPDTYSSDSGAEACVGVAGKAKLGGVKVKGPKSAKRGKATTYRVKVRNVGGATAKGVKVKMSGKGVKAGAKVGNIRAGKSKTVKLKAKFRKKGKIKATIKVTSKNAGKKTARMTVKVR